MSNTLNSPVEALELEFPLRVTEHSIRRGTGGGGETTGGDGVAREFEALAPLQYSLMTERRHHPPPGGRGGGDGTPGRNMLIDPGAPAKTLSSKTLGVLRPGQRLRIETPGGAGRGRN